MKSGINGRLLKEAKKQLSEYFDGKRKDFDLSLAPEGTAFQTKVWNLLRTIPYGKTSFLQRTRCNGRRQKQGPCGWSSRKR